MKDLRMIVLFGVAMAALLLTLQSGVWLSFLMMTFYAVLLSQSWNVLGGFGGQLSFGHALFFGVGAYAQAIAQLQKDSAALQTLAPRLAPVDGVDAAEVTAALQALAEAAAA